MNDIVLTAEAARLAGVVPATIRWWARTGRLPTVQVTGGVRLFSKAMVLHVANSREGTVRRRKRAK